MSKGSLRGRRLKGKRKGVLGKGVLGAREMRGACEEGGRETPRAWSRALIPFPFPFKRLPRRPSERGSIYQYKVYERVTFSLKNDI